MKKYIKICGKCGNTFQTDNQAQRICYFCLDRQMKSITQWGKEQGNKKKAHKWKRLLKKAFLKGQSLIIPALRKGGVSCITQ